MNVLWAWGGGAACYIAHRLSQWAFRGDRASLRTAAFHVIAAAAWPLLGAVGLGRAGYRVVTDR